MSDSAGTHLVPVEQVEKRIHMARGEKVLLLVISRELGILPTIVDVFGRLYVSQSTVDMLRSLVQTRRLFQSDGFLSFPMGC